MGESLIDQWTAIVLTCQERCNAEAFKQGEYFQIVFPQLCEQFMYNSFLKSFFIRPSFLAWRQSLQVFSLTFHANVCRLHVVNFRLTSVKAIICSLVNWAFTAF